MEPLNATEQLADGLRREVLIAAMSYVAAGAAGMSLAFRGRSYRDGWHLASIGFCGGFVGFCFVAFVCGLNGGSDGIGWWLAFIAVAVGLSGKKVESYPFAMLEALLRRFGFELIDTGNASKTTGSIDSSSDEKPAR